MAQKIIPYYGLSQVGVRQRGSDFPKLHEASPSESAEHPVVSFFNRNKELVERTIYGKLKTVSPMHRDTLTPDNVMSEVFLRTSNIPPENLTDAVIEHEISNVVAGKGKDYATRNFEARVKLISQMGSDDDEKETAEFVLENPQNDLSLDRVEPDLHWLEISRARLLKAQDILTDSQRVILELVNKGLSKVEIAEITGKRIDNVTRILELIEGRLIRKSHRFSEPPPNSRIVVSRWNRLADRERDVVQLHLLGLNRDATIEDTGVMGQKGLSHAIGSAKLKLDLDSRDIIRTRRTNMLKQKEALDRIKNSFLNFIYPGGIPESNTNDPQYIYQNRLFIMICRLMPLLTPLQQHDVKLYIQGNRLCDISSVSNRHPRNVQVSINNSRRKIKEALAELENMKNPQNVDKVKLTRLHPKFRKILATAPSRLTLNEAQKSLLMFLYPEGIPHSNIEQPQEEFENQLSEKISEFIKQLTLQQKQDVELYISGKQTTEIGKITNRSKNTIADSLNKAKEKLLSLLESTFSNQGNNSNVEHIAA